MTPALTAEITEIAGTVQKAVIPDTITQYFATLPAKALSLGVRVLLALIILFIASRLIRWQAKIMAKALAKSKADPMVSSFLCSCTKAALYVILVFLLAAYLGVVAASIVALLGSAGVAIGLAIQGSLSNFAGGVLILLLKPFKVGDYIVEHSTGREGTVTNITVFYTYLSTFDNQRIILPNGTLANAAITNVTHEGTRRIDIKVSISYRADIQKAKDVLGKMLEESELVLQDRPRMVVVDALGDSGVAMIVRFWTKRESYWNAKFELTEKTKLLLDEAGVEIPYPQLDVHIKEGPKA